MSQPKINHDDTDKMREAISALTDADFRFSRPSRYQLKIGNLSFYPDSGKIFRDGDRAAWDERGLQAFTFHLQQSRKPREPMQPKLSLIVHQASGMPIDLTGLTLTNDDA